ncbi:MAG TPA: hypothetical protein VEA37_08845, partial [Flavobacterium sp.]|nr:hypothetical protein [Flavobacterium sp.]
MKNFTLLIALFFSLIITAQDHPGKRPEMLLGKEVTVKELPPESQAWGYESFYKDEKMLYCYEDNGDNRTKHEALANKTFTVVSVQPGVNIIGVPMHIIKLKASDGTLFFLEYYYNSKYYFQVKGGLEYPADFYCDYITASLYGQTEIYEIQPYDAIKLSKIKLGEKKDYLLSLSTLQAEIDLTEGVIITLENGSKIIKPDLEAEV